MKELNFTLDGFTEGLRQYSEMPRNSEGLVECFNLLARPQGLVSAPTILQSVLGLSTSYPFPQVFFGSVHWLCCTEDKIYTINGDWSVTLALDVSIYYGTFPDAPKGVWHLADFHEYVVLSNGGVNVVYNPATTQWEFNNPATLPTLGTVCNIKGQLIGSGVTVVAGDPKTSHPDASEVDENYLVWGKIGSASVRLDQSNVAGYRPMPWYGEIYKVLELGEGFVVYGSNGIALFRFNGVVPSLLKWVRYGIASRDAVAGDYNKHVLVDVEGNLRVITQEVFESEPVYKEFFSGMLGGDVIVTLNSYQGDYYVTDGSSSYCLSRTGLTQVFQAVTGLGVLAGQVVGFYADLGDDEVRVTSDVMDFGVRGRKTLSGLGVGVTSSEEVYVSVDYRMSHDGEFESTGWVEVNPEGNVVLVISAVEFRVKFKSTLAAGVKLDYLVVRVKFDDKRFTRGINVNKATA